MESNCVFCKIIKGEIPSERIYEDGEMIVIRDIEPKAKIHYLAIPKRRHYKLLSETNVLDRHTIDIMLDTIAKNAKKWGLGGGYRLVINQGDDAGQTVPHLHIHIMGGQPLDFPDLREKH